MSLTISLTLDDAPMLGPERSRIPQAIPDFDAMDVIREGLQRMNVPHCVAFVIGAMAEYNAEPLERWLQAGYELGNHTHDHIPAHESNVSRFMESVERCDERLTRLGAFPVGRRKWFRFPLLDYGAPGIRQQLRAALSKLGYGIAHASTDLYDHAYEPACGRAARNGDPFFGAIVQRRFRRSAAFSVWQSRRLITHFFGPRAPLVLYSHFGRVSREGLLPVLERLQHQGATWCSLEHALEHEMYRRMDQDSDGATGLSTGSLRRSITWRATRKALLLSRPASERWLQRLGPTLPAFYDG